MRLDDVKKYVDAPEFPYNRDEDYEQWKDARFDFVGSSTIASILGLNKYQSALETWSQYVARKSTYQENDYTRTGHHMEPIIQELAERQYGYKIVPYNVSHISREFPIASATPDGIVFAEHRDGPGVNEVKFTSARADLDVWDSGEAPAWVLAQAQWQCGVCKLQWGVITAMVQGRVSPINRIEFEFDEKFFKHAVAEAQRFLEHVKNNIPFSPSTSDKDNKILDSLATIDRNLETSLPDSLDNLPEEYLQITQEITTLNKAVETKKKRKRELERRLKDECGGAGVVRYDGGRFKISEVNVSERLTPGFSYYRITHKKGK